MEQKIDRKKETALLKELPEALAGWYPSQGKKRVLQNRGEYERFLEEGEASGTVVLTAFIEKERDIGDIIRRVYEALPGDGKLLLELNNRLGIRYFCGDRDPYTGRNFDPMEDYRRAYAKEQDHFSGRMYSHAQIERMLKAAGIGSYKFYAVLSDLNNPFLLYAEGYMPREDLKTRAIPTYNYPDTVFLQEEYLYDDLVENGLFHRMADAFLVECAKDGRLSDVLHVTSSVERGHENGLYTLIHGAGTVEKRAIHPEGEGRIQALYENGRALQERGIRVLEGRIEGKSYRMPYVEAPVGQMYLLSLLREDKAAFLEALDHFRDLILQSAEIREEEEYGQVFERAYVDMVPLNSFYLDGEFVFYDQEFALPDYPVKVVLYRMLCTFFAGGDAGKYIDPEELYERYGLKEELEKWVKLEREFMVRLRNEDVLSIYHEKIRQNPAVLNANRQRLNFSDEEFQRRFVTIFQGMEGKKRVLFGSGRFAAHFMEWYGKEYPVAAVVDNNEAAWGKELGGVRVGAPSLLAGMDKEECRVIVCIKSYLSVMRQLQEMGIEDYVFYDMDRFYDTGRQGKAERGGGPGRPDEAAEGPGKKYRVGYVAGVFDMFHVGHVNLLRKAKSMCEYLIVGVVSDEGVCRQKQRHPVIPCADRCEMIRACRYADQVEELPPEHDGIRDAYRRFRFDVQFSGDDHHESLDWQANKEFLRRNGADLVFFPYTEKISSTMLREQLGEKAEESPEG